MNPCQEIHVRKIHMTTAIENLNSAMQRAMAGRPKVGGFPYLAEVLRQAGVRRNSWSLPSCQSLYVTDKGVVVMQGTPLVSGMTGEAVIAALRTDQAGKSTFPEFLAAAWKAGVFGYEVDFEGRVVTYWGAGR